MVLNDYWKIIQESFLKTQEIRKEIMFDECIIMPNHIHAIIIIQKPVGNADMRSKMRIGNNIEIQTNREEKSVGNAGMRSDIQDIRSGTTSYPKSGPHACGPYENETLNRTKNILSNTIQGFKAFVTKEIRQNYGDHEFAWQKSFFDVIIRNDEQLEKTREYIILNPEKWELDTNNLSHS